MKHIFFIAFLFLCGNVFGQGDPPLKFGARLQVNSVAGSDPAFIISGSVQDDYGLFNAANIVKELDSIYTVGGVSGGGLMVFRIDSVLSLLGNNFVLRVDDINNTGETPSTGQQWAVIEFTDNFQFPVQIPNITPVLQSLINNRFVQRLDAAMANFGTAEGECLSKTITKTSHGFVVGQGIASVNGVYVGANIENLLPAIGVVTQVTDVNNFVLGIGGQCTVDANSYDVDTAYYLPDATGAAITEGNKGDTLQYLFKVVNDSTFSVGVSVLFATADGGGITTGDKGDIDVVNVTNDWRIDTGAVSWIKLEQAVKDSIGAVTAQNFDGTTVTNINDALSTIDSVVNAERADLCSPLDYSPPFSITRNGSNYIVNPAFNLQNHAAVNPQRTYYVNINTGSDANNGLTWGAAFKGLDFAITTGNATNKPYRIYIAKGFYYNQHSWNFTTPTQSCEIIGDLSQGVGSQIMLTENTTDTYGAWSLVGNHYEATWSTEAPGGVRDGLNLTSRGGLSPLTNAGSVGAVDTTPGTFFTDGTKVYIRTIDSRLPDNDLFWNGHSSGGAMLVNSDNISVYVKNVDVYYGMSLILQSVSAGGTKIYFDSVNLHTTSATIIGIDEFIYQNSTLIGGGGDLLNYDVDVTTITNAIENNIKAWNGVDGSGSTSQISTGHNGCNIIRINGQYGVVQSPYTQSDNIWGQAIADVTNSDSWNMGMTLRGMVSVASPAVYIGAVGNLYIENSTITTATGQDAIEADGAAYYKLITSNQSTLPVQGTVTGNYWIADCNNVTISDIQGVNGYSTDPLLADSSFTELVTEGAVKGYVDTEIAGIVIPTELPVGVANNLLRYNGTNWVNSTGLTYSSPTLLNEVTASTITSRQAGVAETSLSSSSSGAVLTAKALTGGVEAHLALHPASGSTWRIGVQNGLFSGGLIFSTSSIATASNHRMLLATDGKLALNLGASPLYGIHTKGAGSTYSYYNTATTTGAGSYFGQFYDISSATPTSTAVGGLYMGSAYDASNNVHAGAALQAITTENQTITNRGHDLLFTITNIGASTVSTGMRVRSGGVVDATTGFRIGNAATSGNYLRGNGTNFVSSAIQSADIPDAGITWAKLEQAVKDSINAGGTGGSTNLDTLKTLQNYKLRQVSINNLAANEVPVFILTGQSNAEGGGDDADGTAGEVDANTNVKILSTWPGGTGTWQNLNIAANYTNGRLSTQHGAELEWQNIRDTFFPNKTLWIIKHAQGGTQISPTHLPGGSVYDSLWVNYVQAGINSLIDSGYIPVVSFYYMQGESDASAGGAAATNYEANLRKLIAYWQSNISPDLPVSIGRVNHGSYGSQATINAAQLAVAADFDMVASFSTAGYPKVDADHFDYDGQKLLARAFYDCLVDTFGVPGIRIYEKLPRGATADGNGILSGGSLTMAASATVTSQAGEDISFNSPTTSPLLKIEVDADEVQIAGNKAAFSSLGRIRYNNATSTYNLTRALRDNRGGTAFNNSGGLDYGDYMEVTQNGTAITTGYYSNVRKYGGASGNLLGFWSNITLGSGLTSDNAWNFRVESPISSGTIGNAYALYMKPQKVSGVTTGWGIYQEGTTDINYFQGLVGIGATSPSAPLHVINTSSQLRLGYSAGVYSNIGVNNLGYLGFTPTGGRIGINTVDPIGGFHVHHAGSSTAGFVVGDGPTPASNTGIYLRSSGLGYIGTLDAGGKTRITSNSAGSDTGQGITVLAGGNTGIGTVSPAISLDVRSAAANTTAVASIANTTVTTPLKTFATNATPESAITGSPGDVARSNAGNLYVKETGSASNTGWKKVTTATDIASYLPLAGGTLTGTLNGTTINVTTSFQINGSAIAKAPFTGTLIFGNGGASYTHSSGVEAYYNTLVGVDAGNASTTSNRSVAVGYQALYSATTVAGNTAIGYQSAFATLTGSANTSVGRESLYTNTTGINNVSLGFQANYLNLSANFNTGLGYRALYSNSTGDNNTAVGNASLYENTSGANNTALGSEAGRYISGGVTANTTGSSSLFLGNGSKALADGQTNQIVIGPNAVGIGSNSVVLGDDNVTKTALKGAVGIGTTSPNASAALDVTSTTKGLLMPRMTATQASAITPVAGLIVYVTDTDATFTAIGFWGYVDDGTAAWEKLNP